MQHEPMSIELALAQKIGLLVIEIEKLTVQLAQARQEAARERELRMKVAEASAAPDGEKKAA